MKVYVCCYEHDNAAHFSAVYGTLEGAKSYTPDVIEWEEYFPAPTKRMWIGKDKDGFEEYIYEEEVR